MNKPKTLNEWRGHIADLNPRSIDLTLERIQKVASKLNVLDFTCPVIIVGGTNGKGSVVRLIEMMYHKANYRVGTYTTPHLFDYCEQVRIDSLPVSEAQFCSVFDEIDNTRGDVLLTEYEFLTLAALLILHREPLDIIILEVCMGGRLDAVNCIDADLVIITNVALDHTQWLGDTREKIAFEKAGIIRKGIPVIYGEMDLPIEIEKAVKKLDATLYQQGCDFDYKIKNDRWDFSCKTVTYERLPFPKLYIENSAVALQAIEILWETIPVSEASVHDALESAELPGRFQIIEGKPLMILDVAHNPSAAKRLKKNLQHFLNQNQILKVNAVFSMFDDKAIEETIFELNEVIHCWYISELSHKRKASREKLLTAFNNLSINNVIYCRHIKEAYNKARETALLNGIILSIGSFHVVVEHC